VSNKKLINFEKSIRQYQSFKKKGDMVAAEENLRLALKNEINNYSVINELALICIDNKKYEESLDLLLRAEKIKPNDNVILNNIGNLYSYLGNFSLAFEYLEKSIRIDSNYLPAFLNFGAVLNHLGKDKELFDLTLGAITKWPQSPELHVNLAAALNGMQLLDEAIISLNTALLLKPNYVEALLNLAAIESQKGNGAKAIEIYEKFISENNECHHERVPLAKYFLSFEYLARGELKKGWEYYDFGFDKLIPHHIKRRPDRIFNVPKWEGDPLGGKTILIWAEQGLGDEIIFMSMIPSLIKMNPNSNIIIECDRRLHDVVSRSFPLATVRSPTYNPNNFNSSEKSDFDFHIPMAGLSKFYRNSINDFYSDKFILKVSLDLRNKYLSRLKIYDGLIKVGISWRSGLLNSKRNKYYSALIDWEELFKLKNVVFINLQYGECESEIVEAEEKYSIKIVRWADIDLKNDLDDVFSIMDCLDLVITAPTAVNCMAGSLGKTVCMYWPKIVWNSFGTDNFPFVPSVLGFTPTPGSPVAECFPKIREYINTKFPITR
jgi:tetratricopeptide (TPR) repeat protein